VSCCQRNGDGVSAVAARVAARKALHPELYCASPNCLWQTGGGNCPRHGGPFWSRARELRAASRSVQVSLQEETWPGDDADRTDDEEGLR
jgi:hypothetical protein